LADSDDLGELAGAYLEKRAQLVRFFTVRTRSAAEAEDIVQEIFLRIGGVDPASVVNPVAYLYKLGSNILLDRVRSERRALVREHAYADAHSEKTADGPAADTPSPEEVWAARRRLERVLGLVDAFPPQRRRVFIMHKIEGLSYGEIAEVLAVSKSAIEKHMIAALRDLAKLADDG
jgi:RNA polymerase sigma-70 factor (ECF subfamily)